MATTYYVDATAGNDANPGSQAQPKQTIQAAALLCVTNANDTVMIASGTYNEGISTVRKTTTFLGYGSTKPIMFGGGLGSDNGASAIRKGFDIGPSSSAGVTIKNLEITGYREYGIEAEGLSIGAVSNFKVEDCHIHHILWQANGATNYMYGIRVDYGNPTIQNNIIHDIGQGLESYGVWLGKCNNFLIDNNEIFAVRKQCVRVWECLSGQISNNVGYLAEGAWDTSEAYATLIANNFSFRTSYGLQAKHNNNPSTLMSNWGYDANTVPNPVRFWHNTSWHVEYSHIMVAYNDPPLALTQWKNNICVGPGSLTIYDQPDVRDDTALVDVNIYDDETANHYRRGNDQSTWVILPTMADVQADSLTGGIGWDQNSQVLSSVPLVDTTTGNLNPLTDYRSSTALTSVWGDQIGARNVRLPTRLWTEYPGTVYASSTNKPAQFSRITDGYGNDTYMITNTAGPESVSVDLGSVAPFNYFTWSVWSHLSNDATKDWTLHTASSSGGPWTQVASGTFPDDGGSTFKWDLGQTFTTQYVKFTGVNNWGNTTRQIFSDIHFGLLEEIDVSIPLSPVKVRVGNAWVDTSRLIRGGGQWL